MISKRIIGAISVLLIVVILSMSIKTNVVSAGNNGQQIAINNSLGTPSRIVIRGTNQSNRYVSYDSSVQGRAHHRTYGTMDHTSWINGWWWKGNVSVTMYWSWAGRSRTCTFIVPTRQIGDWSEYVCNP